MYWLLAITATSMVQIENIYVANIVFFIWVILRACAGYRHYELNKTNFLIFAFYIGWNIFSMFVFILQYRYLSVRNIVQLVFNFQYLILLVYGSIDKEKLQRAMHVCSLALALAIIGLWITKMSMMNIPSLIVNYRMWAEGYIEGWPNSTILPLVFGIFLELKVSRNNLRLLSLLRVGVLLFAVLLCGSRTGYIGAAFVIAYFSFSEKEETKRVNTRLKHTMLAVAIAVVVVIAISTIAKLGLGGRMFMVADRLGIYKDSLAYAIKRPLTGYGGNSIDVIYWLVGKTTTGINWGHTHNTVFELLIRCGIIGLILFMLMIFRIPKTIRNNDNRVMYWILWFLSLFQIYYRNFVFLLLIYLLLPYKKAKRESLDAI